MGCHSGCLMSSASLQKLFCGIFLAFKCSFNEFLGEKVISPSYSSAILEPPLSLLFILFYFILFLSLLFNKLSRLVITFLPRSKHLLISWLQSQSAVILEPKKIMFVTVSIVSPSICREVVRPDALILVFWMLSFKPTFSLSSFTFIKRLFSYFSLSPIMVVSSAYLRLLIFLLPILIPACASSSSAFFMMYCAHKLHKQGDNIQPWCTLFLIWNQSVVSCPVLLLSGQHADFSRSRSGGLAIPSL